MVVPVASVGVGRNELAVDVEMDGAEDEGCATTTEDMPAMLPTEMVVSNGTAADVVTALDLVVNALMLWIGLFAKELLMLLKFHNLAEQHVWKERSMEQTAWPFFMMVSMNKKPNILKSFTVDTVLFSKTSDGRPVL